MKEMAASDKVCDGSNVITSFLLQNDTLPCDPLWLPTSSSSTLRGAKSMVSFEDVGGEDTIDTLFFQPLVKEENGDDDYDVCLNPPGKKRRLTASQVQFLERNFEVENKLEPERKIQLAKEVGLQPRQVAIWFQNRRARFKNKQLEKDYDSLKASYDKLKADYDNLLKEKENLRNEVVFLKEKLLAKEKGMEYLEPLNAINSVNAEIQNSIPISASEKGSDVPIVIPKQEDASSAKSDVFDSDSPHSFLEPADSSHAFEPDQSDISQDEEDDLCRSFLPPRCFSKLYHDPPANSCNFDSPHSFLEPADSSHAFEPDQSDISQDEEDDLCRSFLPPRCFSKLYHDPPANSCNFEFPVEDQPFWSWSY